MVGKGVKIDIQCLYVSGEMYCFLGVIDYYYYFGGVSKVDSLCQVWVVVGDVGYLIDGQYLVVWGNQCVEVGDIWQVVGVKWQFDYFGVGLFGYYQSGYEVGMMFGFVNDNFIVRLQVWLDVVLCYYIDGFGGFLCLDDIFVGRGVKLCCYVIVGCFVVFGQLLGGGELVVMDIVGVQVIKLVVGVDYCQWFECCCGVVEIDVGIGQSWKLCVKVCWVECVYGIFCINIVIVV